MKQKYSVWDAHINTRTFNWGGKEWVVDGENGRWFYPGNLDRAVVIEYYEKGVTWNAEM